MVKRITTIVCLTILSLVTISHASSQAIKHHKYNTNLTSGQIQDRANKVNGIATECVMDEFYLNPSNKIQWQKIEGMSDGRHGIDGLYVKVVDGVVKDVLVAESKWNHSRLGSTKNKTIKQMSKQWILDKLKEIKVDKKYIKTKDRTISINLKHPQNKFFSSLVDSFDRCRVLAIKKKLPMLDSEDVKELLSDGYIEGKDIEQVLSKEVVWN